jgi:hypothetical protein
MQQKRYLVPLPHPQGSYIGCILLAPVHPSPPIITADVQEDQDAMRIYEPYQRLILSQFLAIPAETFND